MATEKEIRDNSFKGINILYYSLVAGQIMIAAILFYWVTDGTREVGFSWEMDNPFHLIVPTLVLASIVMSTFLYNSRLREGRSQNGFFEKLKHYRVTIIIKSALMEGANLICLISFFMTQNYFFLFLFFIGLAAFLVVRPSIQVFKDNYKLTEEERMELRKMTS